MNNKKFKRIVIIVVLILLALISIASAGIDEMKQRDPGMPPNVDNPGNGNGNGGGNGGGNPNVPIDDYIPILMVAAGAYGIYSIRTKPQKNF